MIEKQSSIKSGVGRFLLFGFATMPPTRVPEQRIDDEIKRARVLAMRKSQLLNVLGLVSCAALVWVAMGTTPSMVYFRLSIVCNTIAMVYANFGMVFLQRNKVITFVWIITSLQLVLDGHLSRVIGARALTKLRDETTFHVVSCITLVVHLEMWRTCRSAVATEDAEWRQRRRLNLCIGVVAALFIFVAVQYNMQWAMASAKIADGDVKSSQVPLGDTHNTVPSLYNQLSRFVR